MRVVLTSDGISSPDVESALLGLLDREAAASRACIVTTASSAKEKSNSAVRTQQWLRERGFACADFLDVEHDDPRLLHSYDVLYLNGGNPFYLLLWLKKRGATEIVREMAERNRTIVGTSAGAMVLAPTLRHVNELNRLAGYEPMDLDELGGDYAAIGITDVTAIPHYNRFVEADPGFERKLRLLELEHGIPFTRIRDGEAFVIAT